MSNAGLSASIKLITKILPISHNNPDSAMPMSVYVEAIMALRNIAKKEPRMVHTHN